jgi:hypothetical protein
MSLLTIDKTSETPTINSSEGFVAYKDLGPRPICSSCDNFTECPECSGDNPFKIPVVSGDLVYMQFRMNDSYNTDPENPAAGWFDGPSSDFYISAELEFSSGETLELIDQSIVAGSEVGFFQGSYQNLILNSAAIMDYVNTELIEGRCFKINITTYKIDYPPYIVIFGLFPAAPSTNQPTGTVYYNSTDDEFFQIVGGVWVPYTITVDYVYSQRDGKWYEWTGSDLVPMGEITETKVTYEQCSTAWYQFVNCELTVKIEGLHGEIDCRGYYYGGEIRFRDRYRIWASLEINGYRTDKTINENEVVTEFKQFEKWLLRLTKGHPAVMMERIANTFVGSQVFLEDNEYVNISDIEKNNEQGLHWWSQVTLERLNCEKSTGCADEIFSTPLIICDDPNPETVGEPVSLIGELGDYSATAVCGSTFIVPAATVEDSEGNILGQVDAGETIVVPCGDPSGGGDVIVQNSDVSYEETVPCGDTLILEDYTINVIQDGVTVETVTVPAMSDTTINIIWV